MTFVRPGSLVEPVDVLGDERESRPFAPASDHLRGPDSVRSRQSPAAATRTTPRRARILGKGFGRRELLRLPIAPEASRAAKGRHAARRRYARRR